jgi:putative membrane protein
MNMKSMSFALFAVVALTSGTAFAKTSNTAFVKTAAIANKFEIDTSQLALQKTQNDDVKNFAQQMVDDHNKVGDAMKDALSSSKTKMTPPDTLDKKHQALMDKLQKMNGAAFDKEYVKIQLSAHKEAVKLFSDYSKSGGDKSLKDFAGQNLPTLKDHLDNVMKLDRNLKGMRASR